MDTFSFILQFLASSAVFLLFRWAKSLRDQ